MLVNGQEITLRSYQKKAISAVVGNRGNLLIAASAGAGKTLIGLMLRKIYPKLGKTLIVCPSPIKLQWERECRKILPDLNTCVLSGLFKRENFAELIKADVVICNYDILANRESKKEEFVSDKTSWTDALCSLKFNYMIVDETQKITNPDSARTKSVMSLARAIPHRVLLSATPYTTTVSSLWSQLFVVDPLVWYDYKDFCRKYVTMHPEKIRVKGGGVKWVNKEESPSKEKMMEIRRALSCYVLSIPREEVYKEFPVITECVIPLEVNDKGLFDAIKVLMNKDMENPEEVKQARVLYGNLRMRLSEDKIDKTVQFIEDFITHDKIVVFAVYRKTVEELQKKLGKKAVHIYGGINEKDRQNAIEKFIKDEETRCIILNLDTACGIDGLNLATTYCLFLDLSSRSYIVQQALGRIQRVNSDKNGKYVAYFMQSDCALDRAIMSVCKRRQKISEAVIDGKIEDVSEENDVKAIVKELNQQNTITK